MNENLRCKKSTPQAELCTKKPHLAVFVALAAIGLLGSSIPARAQSAPFASNQSWSSCTGMLCIDAPPQGPQGLDGSGGWGWNPLANAPVTTLSVGKPATFTVTVLQPSTVPFCGLADLTITLTYSSANFALNGTDSRSNI
ncbi:MAG TPA: hypothetical protein VHS08_00685, partial [Candidatus Acidoferrales bacterium]|nr:hypothetical protein [Candidatus Acidoferrales bacterium]